MHELRKEIQTTEKYQKFNHQNLFNYIRKFNYYTNVHTHKTHWSLAFEKCIKKASDDLFIKRQYVHSSSSSPPSSVHVTQFTSQSKRIFLFGLNFVRVTWIRRSLQALQWNRKWIVKDLMISFIHFDLIVVFIRSKHNFNFESNVKPKMISFGSTFFCISFVF